MAASRLPKQALQLLRQETYRIQCQPAATETQRKHKQAFLSQFLTHEYAAWTNWWKLPLKIKEDEQEEARKTYLAIKWVNTAATTDMLFYKRHIRPDPVYGMARYLTAALPPTRHNPVGQVPTLKPAPIRVITERASLPRVQRLCLQCQQQAVDDKHHLIFDCPVVRDTRSDFQLCATQEAASRTCS